MKLILTIATMLFLTSPLFAAESTVHSGEGWQNKSKKTSGAWKVVEDGGKHFVVLGDKFKTSRGPDLKLFVSPHAIESIGKKQKIENDGKLVAELKKTKGAQRYEIPASINLADFKSLVIHCEKYTVVWGGVSITM